MKVEDLKREDLKELKRDGYVAVLSDENNNVIEVIKKITDIKTKEYDDIIIF